MTCYLSATCIPPALLTVMVHFAIASAPAFSQEKTSDGLGMRFRRIPAGEFAMGFDHSGGYEELLAAFPRSITPRDVAGDERPQHRVRITRPFELAVHEVTVGQFRAFCEATGYRTAAEANGAGIVGFSPIAPEETGRTGKRRPFARRPAFTWQAPGFEQTDLHPVVGVSWTDATAFCRWLSQRDSVTYRLPTEAEWEYACHKGTETWFSFGDSFRQEIQRHANIADVTLEKTHPELAMRQWLLDVQRDPEDDFVCTAPVGSFRANRWELYDLHGNVWEWCLDRYLADAYRRRADKDKPATDPLNREVQDDVDDWRVSAEVRGATVRFCADPLPEATSPPPMLPATSVFESFVKSGMNKLIARSYPLRSGRRSVWSL